MTIDSLSSPSAATLPLCPLPEFALFRASGADAVSFLHGQLTQDVEHLQASQARLAGYCSPKGRLLATMLVWRDDDAVWMLARADAAQALTRRLAMFILRAKVKIEQCEQPIYGATGATPASAQAPWTRTVQADGAWIAMPAGAGALPQWLYLPAADARAELPVKDEAAAAQWTALHLHAGIAWIGGATADLFVPQNVNFDCVGGINFRKGCYPGQEVVARSHYRGTLKRRMGLGELDGQAIAGQDIFDAQQPEDPAGRIVASAGGTVLLEAPLEALQGNGLRYGAADGPAIRLASLPYSLDKPEP